MYVPDKQQAHSRRYEGPDLARHKTQALFARTNCKLRVQLHNCLCTSTNIGSPFAAGIQPFRPLPSPVMLLLTLSGLLELWIPCWEAAVFAAGVLASISYPAPERTRPWARAVLLKRWTNITRVLSLLVQLWCFINEWERQKLFPPATFLVTVVTAIAFHIPMKPHPLRFLGKNSHEWACSSSKL